MGGKENTQLALSSSKFLCVRLIRVREAETVFALRLWHWDTPPHRLVLVRLRTDLFSAFVCGSSFSTHHHRRYCGIYQRRALPTEWCLSWREDWGDASFFFTRVSTWARRSWQSPVLTQRQPVEPWWIVWILKLIQEVRSSHFQGYKTQIPRGRPLCSHCTRPG